MFTLHIEREYLGLYIIKSEPKPDPDPDPQLCRERILFATRLNLLHLNILLW